MMERASDIHNSKLVQLRNVTQHQIEINIQYPDINTYWLIDMKQMK